MRKLAMFMALASTALATPAVALDKSWYAGVEGGAMLVEDTHLNYDVTTTNGTTRYDDAILFNHKTGVDLDLVGGYDFGWLRLDRKSVV